ncbi:hypothetical protein CEXT_11791 [Caerostris extrusa]|uniref:Uncharacterized protein n=1 Tax=Caerostris extrusa TaxID=172846 RepID=A0AAV4YBX9_CAEEX|nr:hypothetical protein CEXT_11791 [Caerostris extrusa]
MGAIKADIFGSRHQQGKTFGVIVCVNKAHPRGDFHPTRGEGLEPLIKGVRNGGLLATLRDATVPEPRWLVYGSRLREGSQSHKGNRTACLSSAPNHKYERRKNKVERRKKAVFPKSANSIPSAQYDWNGCHLDDRICERGPQLGDRQTPSMSNKWRQSRPDIHDIRRKTFGGIVCVNKANPGGDFHPHVTK